MAHNPIFPKAISPRRVAEAMSADPQMQGESLTEATSEEGLALNRAFIRIASASARAYVIAIAEAFTEAGLR